MLNDGALWEVGGTNLLGNTTSLASLNVGPSQFIENEGLSGIDVAKNAENRASQLEGSLLLLLLRFDDFLLSGFLLCLQFGKSLCSSGGSALALGSLTKYVATCKLLLFLGSLESILDFLLVLALLGKLFLGL